MLTRHAILTAVLLAGLGLSGCALMLGKSSGTLPPAVAQDLKACNIVWDSPSRDSFDSMPLPGAQRRRCKRLGSGRLPVDLPRPQRRV